MTSRVRVAAGIPQAWMTGGIDRPRIRRFLERAEALGFESAWVVEQVLGTLPCLEPVQLLSWAAEEHITQAGFEYIENGCAAEIA